MEERHITVPRTARYHTLGEAASAKAIWIVLHGYGHLARYFLRTFEGLEEGLFSAAPEGLSRYYLDEGHTRVGATWMTREDREKEIADQLTYLDLLASSLKLECGKDVALNVLGFSQGVATACRWTALGATTPSRLVLWGGSMPPDLENAVLTSRWKNTRVELVHGEKDTIVPAAVLAQSEARLRQAGINYDVHRFDGAHALDKFVLKRLITA
jgi:predicted esterase